MYLQFNAFIPGFLGLPLEMAVALNNHIALNNEAAFYRNAERAGGYRNWMTEPFSTNTFCSTDTRNFGEHNILTRKDNFKSRLYIYPLDSLINGINLKSIGRMKQKYPSKVFNKLCGPCNRVAVNFEYDYGGLHATPSHSPGILRQNPNVGCHYGHYRAPMYGTVYEFPSKTVNPNASAFNYPDMVVDVTKDYSYIKTGAQAGYPYLEPLSPNVDFDLVIHMHRIANGYRVEISGTHNSFPYYEMLINGELVYTYKADDFGPGLINLNTKEYFYFSKNFSK